MDRRALVGLLAGLCWALALAAPVNAATTEPVVGIGDQKADMFSDPRFLALGIRQARLSVSWDALDVASQRAWLDSWLHAAYADGINPLISFDHSWRVGHHRMLPSPSLFRHDFARFHARYPWVTDFATWNEANYCGEITCHHPNLVAAYYLAMRSVCPHCRVLAAELLDLPNMVQWAKELEHFAHRQPTYWGLHNYIGANRLSTASTIRLLRSVRGEIWFTEIAGLVARHSRGRVPRHFGFPQSAAHAAEVTRFIFERLARLSPRVKRVYLYEWDARAGRQQWDSALIGADGRPRQAYYVLRDAVRRGLVTLGPAQQHPIVTAGQGSPPAAAGSTPNDGATSTSGSAQGSAPSGGGNASPPPNSCQAIPLVGCAPKLPL